MGRPLILAVDADRAVLNRIEGELGRRYGADFRIRGERTSAAALAELESAQQYGEPVAAVELGHRRRITPTRTEPLGRPPGLSPPRCTGVAQRPLLAEPRPTHLPRSYETGPKGL
jgi:hypothetical protein